MSLNLNKVILSGRMVSDPELKQTMSGVSVVSFRICVNRKYGVAEGQPDADFFQVNAWRNTAEFVCKYFRKGSAICVLGSLKNRTWTDQNGGKRSVTEIEADEVNFVESRATADAGVPAGDANATPAAAAPVKVEIKSDDDLPF